MSIFDTILIVILSGFVFYGLFFGLIRTLGALIGAIIGAWVASHYYLSLFELIQGAFLGLDNFGRILSFLIVFSFTQKVVGLAFSLIDKTFNLLSIIPFLKTFNRLGGAILGFLEGSLVIGLFLFLIARYSFINHFLGDALVNSKLAAFFLKFVNIIFPLLPEILKQLKSII